MHSRSLKRLTLGVGIAAAITVVVAGCAASAASSTAASSASPGEGVETTYESTRFTIDTGQEFDEFIAAFEAAVPTFSPALYLEAKDWEEVQANAAAAAPHEFLIYAKLRPSDAMSISGVGRDTDRSAVYLMGNHTIAETMYRHNPGVMLYAPLHVNIFESEDGNALFSIDRPSDQFGSFGNEDIQKVGISLDKKVATLLTLLDVQVPEGFAG